MPQTHAPRTATRIAGSDGRRRPLLLCQNTTPAALLATRSRLSSQRGQRSARASAGSQRRSSNKAGREARSRRRAVVKLGWPSLPRSHAHTPANAPCSSPASLSWNTCSQSQRGNVPSRKDPFPTLCPSSPPTCTNPVAPSLPWSQRPSCVTLIFFLTTSNPQPPALFSPPLIALPRPPPLSGDAARCASSAHAMFATLTLLSTNPCV